MAGRTPPHRDARQAVLHPVVDIPARFVGRSHLIVDGISVRHIADAFLFGNLKGKDVILDFDVGLHDFEIAKGINDIRWPGQVFDPLKRHGNHGVLDLSDGNTAKILRVEFDHLSKDDFQII